MTQRMLTLKALKPHTYGTRHLVAGEEYEAPTEWAIALVAQRKADFVKQSPKPKIPSPPPVLVEPEPPPEASPQTDIDRLREEASALGIDVDGRWGRARLQYEIEQTRR